MTGHFGLGYDRGDGDGGDTVDCGGLRRWANMRRLWVSTVSDAGKSRDCLLKESEVEQVHGVW